MTAGSIELVGRATTWLGLPAVDVGSPFGEDDGWTCLLVEHDAYLIRVAPVEVGS